MSPPTITITRDFYFDYMKMHSEFEHFMTLNLVEIDRGLPEPCGSKIRQVIEFSKANTKNILIFKQPWTNWRPVNAPILAKNLENLLAFFYRYLSYAGPIFQLCRPDIYTGTFANLQAKYREFMQKYFP